VELGRRTRHQQAFKKAKQDKIDRKAKEELKWETKGKATMAEWLNGGISSRADREENPDRDKT
jgi:hypothetical protein